MQNKMFGRSAAAVGVTEVVDNASNTTKQQDNTFVGMVQLSCQSEMNFVSNIVVAVVVCFQGWCSSG
jgi:hypothetical protein